MKRLREGDSPTMLSIEFEVPLPTVKFWAQRVSMEKRAKGEAERKRRNPNEQRAREDFKVGGPPPDPIPLHLLGGEARRALADFGYFRRRYFGRISSPWQERAGGLIAEALHRAGQDLFVINCPPGAGKSTLLHDVACWVICQDRSIRILWLTASGRMVNQYTMRLRRSLERRYRVRDQKLIDAGLAVAAEATLVDDFGRFRPEVVELWRADEFIVEQLDGTSLEDKEPTVAGYGFRGDFIGHRCNLLIPDDVATKSNSREGAERDALLELWDDVIEARLEPDGVLPLTGQRLGAMDLYSHCLGQTMGGMDDDEDVADEQGDDARRLYRHIVFPAYDATRDTGPESRRLTAPAWPDGPLLDPRRIPWRKVQQLMSAKPETYAVAYQQEDGAAAGVLIPDEWVYGGVDATGQMFPGCIDHGRRLWQVPQFDPDDGPVLSVGSIDPSGEKNWAFVWKLYQPQVDYRHIVGLHRGPIAADDVLSWDLANRESRGLMVEWQERSVELNHRITHWVIEENIAKHFLSYAHVRRWMADAKVIIVRHTTHRYNKDHAEVGIEAILRPIWRHGRIRLPTPVTGDWVVQAFISEHRTWRAGKKSGTDFVMADWFPELHWPTIGPPKPLPRLPVPEWLTRETIPA